MATRGRKPAVKKPMKKDHAALRGMYMLEDVHEYRIDRTQFIVYLDGEDAVLTHDGLDEPGVEYRMANRFRRNLNILSGLDPTRPILVDMATCGGFWHTGMQIFDAILTCPNPVTVFAQGTPRSMSSIVPLAADKFIVAPSTQYMYHNGSFAFEGLEEEMNTLDFERRKIGQRMLLIYTARLQEQGKFSTWSRSRICSFLKRSMEKKIHVYLDAAEAREWGFVDEICPADLKNMSRAKTVDRARRKRMFEVLQAHIKPTYGMECPWLRDD